MSDISDYHNKFIQLEGSETKYYITEFDLEEKLTAMIAELEAKIARLVEAGDRMAENWIANFDGEHFDDCPVTLWQRAKEE